MNSMNRRQMFQVAALSSLGFPAMAAASEAEPGFRGTLTGVGFGAGRASKQAPQGSSVVTELNLANGRERHAFLPMKAAHTLLTSASGLSLCLPLDGTTAVWIDANLLPKGSIEAPSGFLFSGHGVVIEDRSLAFITLRRQNALSFADTGRLGVIDLKSRKFVGLSDSGGVRPHDIALVGSTLLVSHYGDINYEQAGSTAGNMRQPSLVTLDAANGRILKIMKTNPVGSLTHFAVGDAGRICAVPLNYYSLDPAGRRAVEKDLGGKPFEISVAEELEGRLGAPMPILMLNAEKESTQEIHGEPDRQRRAQSVSFHKESRRFFITYSFSDALACVDDRGVSYLSSFDMGLSYIRGVCAVDERHIAVTGEFRGVALIDAHHLKLVKRLDVSWFDNPHVSYRVES